jgi:hypothetical protein
VFAARRLGLKPPDPERVGAVVKWSPNLLPVDPLISGTPHDWALGRPWDGNVLDNDILANCGPVAVVNCLKMLAVACGRTDLRFTNQDVLDLYTAMGYDGRPETDDGVVLLDLMEYMQRVGVRGVRFDCFFSIGFGDTQHLATAINLAPVIVGAKLTRACMSTDTWDDAVANDRKTWGGHGYVLHSWSPGGCNGKSWGAPVWSTPGFIIKRVREAYLPVCRELMPGLDYSRLVTLAGQL